MNHVGLIERLRSLTIRAVIIIYKAIAWADKLMGKLKRICAMALYSLAARKALRNIRAILILNRQQS